jgi:hypothetical protein
MGAPAARGRVLSDHTSTQGEIMTLALAVAFNAVLMLALLGALAFVMSRPGRLRPHLSATVVAAGKPVQVRRPVPALRARRAGGALSGARS